MSTSETKKNHITKEKKQDPAPNDVENTGNYLRTLRMSKGLSIKDVSEATHISETNLNAIEDENFSVLPANTFTRGLLNIYTKFLGANSEAVTTKFMENWRGNSSQKRRSRLKHSGEILTPKRLAEPSQISSMTMAGMLFLFIIITFTGYCVYTSWNPFSFLTKENKGIQSVMKSFFPGELPAPETITPPAPGREIAEVPPFLAAEATIEPEELINEKKTDTPAPKYAVTLRFLENTSIELAKDDDETFTEEFKPGDVQSWSAEKSLTITFSKPDSAEILINNSAVPFPEIQQGIYTLHLPPDRAELQTDE